MNNFLIVEKDQDLSRHITNHFQESGYSVKEAFDFPSATDLMNHHIFNVILSETYIPGGSISDLLNVRKTNNTNAMTIVTAENQHVKEAILALEHGAFDFIKKPYSISELDIKVEKAIGIKRLTHEAATLRGERNIIYDINNFIGESPQIKSVFEKVKRVSKEDSTLLLKGEVGTGKELVAGAIHYNSRRKNAAFVKVNCASLSELQLESELFGHEKGAFPGAKKMRVGRIEKAEGGTVFLDGIDSMSLITQGNLLRCIQDKCHKRLGSDRIIHSDVRFILATTKDIAAEIEKGHFRKDLFHWTHGRTIDIPPLRERHGDIILLTFFFLKKSCAEMQKQVKEIQPMAMKLLTEYTWPGNIRELENTIECAVLHCEGPVIKPEDLKLPCNFQPVKWEQKLITLLPEGISLEGVEKDLLVQGLRMCDWIKKDAANILGVSEEVLNYKIKRFGITHPRWK